ncbi:UvrB/UvrC motif-containing protein [[Clostridium] colinum]|uniref:UvrB/UvrC motif-containing protein n=1 Tax=[Clostridium] colinum TaxID=36835 RepID=UPI002025691A|nr:UvrB/UvrC motif-containing protein [[Clostridium] colinum]
MLCEKCKNNNATIKYTQNINGLKVDYNLCDYCFNKIKNNNNFIDNFFNSFFSSNIFADEYEKNYRCNVCGNTFEKLKNTGKVGCSNCYNVFRDKIDIMLNNIQEKNVHIGKNPKNLETYKPSVDTIKLLKQKLNIAVEKENYEEAIKIRDKIKEIERGEL